MQNSSVAIQFLGAAGRVTGSKTFLKTEKGDCLLVDCGLIQGEDFAENFNDLPDDIIAEIKNINYILLTHGHLDHVGFLPRLYHLGFRGTILASQPTLQIAALILKDSASLQEKQNNAGSANGFLRKIGQRILPPLKKVSLYTTKDVYKTVKLFKPAQVGEWIKLKNNLMVRFDPNGHILGACSVSLLIDQRKFTFSGDVGRPNDLILNDPRPATKSDFLFIESTYGDRLHPAESNHEGNLAQLEQVLQTCLHPGGNKSKEGTVLIPAFAVQRAQVVLFLLYQLHLTGKLPDVPIFLDTPMGRDVFHFFKLNPEWQKVDVAVWPKIEQFITIIENYGHTLRIMQDNQPKIVVTASGMVTGGRVMTWLSKYISDETASVVLTGYQAEGTNGRRLLEGKKSITIEQRDQDGYSQDVEHPVKANVVSLAGLSAHADKNELLDWMKDAQAQKVFVMHGEPESSAAFKAAIESTFGGDVVLAESGRVFKV